jgi:hypothetical protein
MFSCHVLEFQQWTSWCHVEGAAAEAGVAFRLDLVHQDTTLNKKHFAIFEFTKEKVNKSSTAHKFRQKPILSVGSQCF